MIRILTLLTLIICGCKGSTENEREKKIEPHTQKQTISTDQKNEELKIKAEVKDTFFIMRLPGPDFYHVVYIDSTKTSKQFKWLSDFSFDENDKQALQSNYQYYRSRHPNSFKKQKLHGLSKEWLPVYPYGGKYYLYAPSDWGNAGRRIINDSSFVYWYMDGPMPVPIKSFKKNNNKYTMELGSYEGGSEIVNLYVLDPKTQLTLFEFPNEPEQYRYQLYTPRDQAEKYGLIINYCKERKVQEFKFNKLEASKLIK